MNNQKIKFNLFFIFILGFFVFSYQANALTWQELISKNKNLFNSNIKVSSTLNFILNNIFATDTLPTSSQQSLGVDDQIINKFQRQFQDEFGDALTISLAVKGNTAVDSSGKKIKYNDGNLIVSIFAEKGQKLVEFEINSIFFGNKSELFLRISTASVDSKLKELINNMEKELKSTSTQALDNEQGQSMPNISEIRQKINETLAEIMGKWIFISLQENVDKLNISKGKNKKSAQESAFDKFFRSLIKKPLGALQLIGNTKYDGVNVSKYSLSINKSQLANNIFDALKESDPKSVNVSDKQKINDFINQSDIKTVELIIGRNNKKIYRITGQAKFILDDDNNKQLELFLNNQFNVKKINYLPRPQQFVEAEKVLGPLMFLLFMPLMSIQ
ncbi:MAG: hypothetical protein KatS3mg097_154 [Candidatus Parcubacteria bacterium]|nr:MAG: hypothetical protein KatS3mg097_154 [Candidatus Parcubacteria bacterium]